MRQHGDNLSVGLVVRAIRTHRGLCRTRAVSCGLCVVVIVGIGLGALVSGIWRLDWVSANRPIADGAYLGLTYIDYNPRTAQRCRCRPGALVTAVDPGSPVDEAGIRPGDVITVFAGQHLGDGHPLLPLLLACQPNEQVALEVWRAGHARQVEIVPRQRN